MVDAYVSRNPSSGRAGLVPFTTTSTGVGSAGKGVGLNDQGVLDPSLLPPGVGAETVPVVAFEALASGDFVAVFNNSGAVAVKKASAASGGLAATGFVLAAFAQGATATVYGLGMVNNGRSGLTPGARQYLSDTTPGGHGRDPGYRGREAAPVPRHCRQRDNADDRRRR
ncbi:MAG: hypothetical protein WCF85_16380 [Rhodospirillaceae bacterium]